MTNLEKKLYPEKGSRLYDVWLSPQDDGDYYGVYIVESGKTIIRKVADMNMPEAISFRNGFCEGIQEMLDLDREERGK